MGVRAVVITVVSTVVLLVLGNWLQLPMTVALVGAVVAMNGATSVQTPDPREQRITTLLLIVPASLSLIVGTLLAPTPVYGDLAFLAVIFASVYVRRYGSPGMALGMMAFLTYFFALFFHAKPSQIPWMIAGIVVGLAVTYLIRFGLMRDRPVKTFRRATDAYRSSIRTLLAYIADVLERPGWTPRRHEGLRRHLVRLNEAAIEIEELLADAAQVRGLEQEKQEALRVQVIDLELATERIATRARRLAQSTASMQLRSQVADNFRRTRGALDDERLPEPLADPQVPLGPALNDLVEAQSRLAHSTEIELERAAGRERVRPWKKRLRSSVRPHPGDTLRTAIQATVAGGLAMVVGQQISTERWYWAVIAAFVVFSRASTLADTLFRATQRVFGTVLGVIAGILAAAAMHGHPKIEFTVLFASIFLAFYLWRASYAWLVFFFTIMLSALYSLLGRYTEHVMYLRLYETLAGAAIGSLTAIVVSPTRPRQKVRASVADVLRSAASYLDDALVRRPGRGENGELLARMRDMDRKTRALRELGRPLSGFLVPLPSTSAQWVHATSSLVFFARQFASCEPWRGLDEVDREHVRAAGAQLIERAEAMADQLDGKRIHAPRSAALFDVSDPRASNAAHWIARMNELLDEIAEALPEPPVTPGQPRRRFAAAG